jgi:hypothetical protein
MKKYGGNVCIDPSFLELGTGGRVVSFTLRPLYPQGKSKRYSLYRRLGEPQSRSDSGGVATLDTMKRNIVDSAVRFP